MKRNRGGRPRKHLASLQLTGSKRSLRRRVDEAQATLDLLKPAARATAKEDAAFERFMQEGAKIRARDAALYKLAQVKAGERVN